MNLKMSRDEALKILNLEEKQADLEGIQEVNRLLSPSCSPPPARQLPLSLSCLTPCPSLHLPLPIYSPLPSFTYAILSLSPSLVKARLVLA